jgi:hypothetical protein
MPNGCGIRRKADTDSDGTRLSPDDRERPVLRMPVLLVASPSTSFKLMRPRKPRLGIERDEADLAHRQCDGERVELGQHNEVAPLLE